VFEILTVTFGKSSSSQKSAYKWYLLTCCNEDVNDNARLDAPAHQLIKNHQQSCWDIGTLVSSRHAIFSDFAMKHVAATFSFFKRAEN
jgi:hypothetical protein